MTRQAAMGQIARGEQADLVGVLIFYNLASTARGNARASSLLVPVSLVGSSVVRAALCFTSPAFQPVPPQLALLSEGGTTDVLSFPIRNSSALYSLGR